MAVGTRRLLKYIRKIVKLRENKLLRDLVTQHMFQGIAYYKYIYTTCTRHIYRAQHISLKVNKIV